MKNAFFLLLFCLPLLASGQASIKPQNLKTEYLINPEGIDEESPRLSWILSVSDSTAFAQHQTAYCILVSSSQSLLNRNEGDQWNSGWISSASMQQIVYKGKTLLSDHSYFWKVAVTDEHGKHSDWSKTAHWSTGLLQREDWSANWIGTGESWEPGKTEPGKTMNTLADPWLRKTIDLKVVPNKAMMFVASVGFHELYVNGKKMGADVLAPCVTDYTRRARYVAYDISEDLKAGKNTIALWLGTSWSIYPPYYTDDKPKAPIVIAQADLYSSDAIGAVPFFRIQTDSTWKTHASPSMLLGSWSFGHMGGEQWDATKEIDNWNTQSCNETDWKKAVVYQPRLMLTAQMVEGNQPFKLIKPVSIETRPDGSYWVDMGVNFAGWTEIRLKGSPFQKVELLFSEREKEDMTFDIHSAFILGKTGAGVFKNRFNYSSGRWVLIKGLKSKPQLSDIKGWVVRTNYSTIASFSCSDSLQNWIYMHTRWNFENLSLGGYVVDCPQRERLGYGGDAHATSETGMFSYELGAFYTKWMQDWRDVQGTKSLDASNYGDKADYGILPHTAPTYDGGGGPGWGGIVVTLPWLVYQQEGDRRILEKNFDLIKNWLAFLDSHTKNELLMHFGSTWDFLGDWLWPHAGVEGMNNTTPQNICFNNCYRVYNLRTAAKIARVLGKTNEAAYWEKEAALSSAAIQNAYYNKADDSYSDASMGNLAAALLAEVPPASLRPLVMKRLEKEILVIREGHIHVGITAGAMLFKLLRNEGRDDLLYSMTSQTDYPGWGYMKANGATSIWEMWEKDLPFHSLLHSSYLYPGAWYMDGVAGIRKDPSNQGFKKFIIRAPMLTESQLKWAKGHYDSPAGTISSAWQRKGGRLSMQVRVPAGSTATLYFPSVHAAGIHVSSIYARRIGSDKRYSFFRLPAGYYEFSGMEESLKQGD